MPTVTVKLSEPEFSQLETMAAASKRTKSDVLREALSACANSSSSVSLLDAMRAYIGKVSGPGDLSTNKARMKGYGKTRVR
jgi:predicted transcriptional regulator